MKYSSIFIAFLLVLLAGCSTVDELVTITLPEVGYPILAKRIEPTNEFVYGGYHWVDEKDYVFVIDVKGVVAAVYTTEENYYLGGIGDKVIATEDFVMFDTNNWIKE